MNTFKVTFFKDKKKRIRWNATRKGRIIGTDGDQGYAHGIDAKSNAKSLGKLLATPGIIDKAYQEFLNKSR